VLDQMDEELAEEFPLWDIIERFDNEQKLSEELAAHQMRVAESQPADKPAGDAPAEKPASEAPAQPPK